MAILSLGLVIRILFGYRRKAAMLQCRIDEMESKETLQGESPEGPPDNPVTNSGNGFERSELEQTQLDLELKEQDLMYHALVITGMKQVNNSIGEKLTPFQYRFSKKKDQVEFQQTLREIIRDTSHDPMQDFEIMFKQMHGGFHEKLLTLCPDLSKGELQVCALLRLNLSSKDIARLTNLSAATIDITRHRIRKKLGLDPHSSLSGYLIQI